MLITKGLERVICDLAESGYDAEWTTISAENFGYPHLRERLFIVAYPVRFRYAENSIFQRNYYPSLQSRLSNLNTVSIEAIGRSYPQIPEYLRMDDGLSNELVKKEIEAILRGLGNAVIPEIGEWIGDQILRFDSEIQEAQ